MISLCDAQVQQTGATGSSQPSEVIEEFVQTKEAPARVVAPVSDDGLVTMHALAQDALRHGVTPRSVHCRVDLERALCSSLNIDPFDHRAVEIACEVLHAALYPDASIRPDRLTIGDQSRDPRE